MRRIALMAVLTSLSEAIIYGNPNHAILGQANKPQKLIKDDPNCTWKQGHCKRLICHYQRGGCNCDCDQNPVIPEKCDAVNSTAIMWWYGGYLSCDQGKKQET